MDEKPNQNIPPEPETSPIILSQNITQQEVPVQRGTAWKKFERWVEHPVVLSGGVAMFFISIGLLLSNAPKWSFTALLISWGLFVWSIFKLNFFDGKTHREQKVRKSIISILLGFGFLVLWLVLLPSPEKLRLYLVPANELTPESHCGELSPNSIKVFFGNVEGYTDNNNTMKLISAFSEPLLTAKKVGNRLQLSIELFDSEGVRIAKIKDNVFVGQVSENLQIAPQDPHGIDIFDKTNNKLVFHIRYLNPQAIEILGEFYAKKGNLPLRLTADGVALPNGMTYSQVCYENIRGWAMAF